MADLFRRKDVELLTAPREGPCVSVFLPTHRKGPGIEQDTLRLKNLLAEAGAWLATVGMRTPIARELLAPAHDLLGDETFWQHQSDGLAVFLAEGWSRVYRLPLDLPELTVVADHFHLKPLLPLLAGNGRFYILALSQNEVRLLIGTRDRVREVDLELEEVPRSLREALRYDDPQKERLFHISGREGPVAVFHGHGIGKEVDKERIRRYLGLVDAGLRELLANERAPLVLAGVEYEQSMYRKISDYPSLLPDGIAGTPDHLSPEELHERAWPLVEPLFCRGQRGAADRYRELAGTGKAVSDVEVSLIAAGEGRVEVLFMSLDEEPLPGGQDSLDQTAIRTLLGGGTVYALPADQIPSGTSVAAILRY